MFVWSVSRAAVGGFPVARALKCDYPKVNDVVYKEICGKV
ncbi:hypothetical protein TcasGA2_TC034152 [Tribolium castaneum]|uniref:Uncharacterized protein n=1 Tax=Tribolium castaneum TaxID=7070 RepID=A0A139WCV5_TRICA|nr:hypothetical protein TcasGA2_TC034152 [Tribolium castaneum]